MSDTYSTAILAVEHNKLSVSRSNFVTSKSINSIFIHFDIRTSDWENTVITAIFNDDYIRILDSTFTCDIPEEAIDSEGELYVGLFGVKQNYRINTNKVRIKVHEGCFETTTLPQTVTQSLYEQIMIAVGLKVDKSATIAGVSINGGISKSTLLTALNVQDGAEQNVNTDWNAVSGDAQLLNKPTQLSQFTDNLGSNPAHTHSQYLTTETDPTVPSWAKQSTKPTYTAQEVGALPDTTPIPSKTSDLVNDSGFLTQHQSLDAYATKTYVDEHGGKIDKIAVNGVEQAIVNKKVDISVVTQETDPTVPSWAKAATKPTYTAQEVGALPANTPIPTKTSDLTNDSGFLTQHQSLAAYRTSAAQDVIDATKENISNKVTSLSSSSTDTQYPSAKAVYYELQDKSEVSVSATGTATDEVQYITINGVEKKLAGGSGSSTGAVRYDGVQTLTDPQKSQARSNIGAQDAINDLSTIRSGASAGATAYQKPNGGIPASDINTNDWNSKATASDLTSHTGNTSNPHNVTKSQVGLSDVENKSSATIRGEITSSNVTTALGYTPLNSNLKGATNGVAELDSNGKVLSAQLPSYVDDVLEYASLSSFPVTGETGKIYIAQDTNKTYRWGGSAYIVISETIALGETSSTAYRGDRGKTAYDHSQVTTGNPHNVTKSDIGLGNVGNFKAVSTEVNQGLSSTEQSNAIANLGIQELTDNEVQAVWNTVFGS